MNLEIPIWPLHQAYKYLFYRYIHKMRKLGNKTTFGYRTNITFPESISIGDRTKILHDVTILVQEGGEGDKISIGSNCLLSNRCFISSAKKITIEDDVILAANVFISDHIHNYEDVNMPIHAQGLSKIIPVVIGERSWLGINCVVMPGVIIGKHCVIGSNSVVTKSLPDYSVAVGIPAKIIKRYDLKKKKWVKHKG